MLFVELLAHEGLISKVVAQLRLVFVFLDLGILNVQVLSQRDGGVLIVSRGEAFDGLTRLFHGASSSVSGNVVLLDALDKVFALCSTRLAVWSMT